MKQRLLTLLVMLFSSFGLIQAQGISITPKEKSTIKITSSEGGFTEKNRPSIGSLTPTGDKNAITYTLDAGKAVTISTDYKAEWGEIALEINGKVTDFAAQNDNLSKHVTSLIFTGNGELANLALGDAPLTTLKCANNKLSKIPNLNTSALASIKTIEIGTQEPKSAVIGSSTSNSKDGVTLTVSGLFESLPAETSFTLEDVTDNAATPNKLIASVKGKNNVFTFKKEDGVFFGGTGDEYKVKATLYINDANSLYNGIRIKNAITNQKISAPTFELGNRLVIEPKDGGIVSLTGSLDEADQTALKAQSYKIGEDFTVIPAAQTGYTFKDLTLTRGLEFVPEKSDITKYTYKVTGKDEIGLKAIFTPAMPTVTYSKTGDGDLYILNKGVHVESGTKLSIGTELIITAKAAEGYAIEAKDFKINGKQVNTNSETKKQEYTITLGEEDLNVTADFKSIEQNVAIDNKQMFYLNITDNDGNTIYKGALDNLIQTIAKDTKVDITFKEPTGGKYLESLTINNVEKKDELTHDGIDTYTLKGLIIEATNTINILGKDRTLIEFDDPKTILTYTYTGKPQPIVYDIQQNIDKKNINIDYKVEGASETTYKQEAYTTVGQYTARFSVKDGGEYWFGPSAKYKTTKDFEITKATPIVEAPTAKSTKVKDGEYKYEFNGGRVYIKDGEKELPVSGKFIEDKTKTNTEDKVWVTFEMSDKDQAANIEDVAAFELPCSADLKRAKVTAYNHADKMEFIANGVIYPSESLIPSGELTIKVTGVEGMDDVELYQVDSRGIKKGIKLTETAPGSQQYKYTIKDTDKELYFGLFFKDNRKSLELDEDQFITNTKDLKYNNGAVLSISSTGLLVEAGMTTPKLNDAVLTYYKNGKEVKQLINAGKYEALIYRAGDNNYKEFRTSRTFFVRQQKLTEKDVLGTAPTASKLNKGHALRFSQLTGGVTNIAGIFEWQDKDVNTPIMKTGRYAVVFVPASYNYTSVTLTETVEVEVTDFPMLTYSALNGEVKAVNTNDKDQYFKNESEIKEQVTLRFTATPNPGYEFDHFIINTAGTRSLEYNNDKDITIKEHSVDVKAIFRKSGAPVGTYEVNIVNLANQGLEIIGAKHQEVKVGKPFSFAVRCHKDDYSKVVVKVNGEVKAGNGTYYFESVKNDLNIQVSLENPTPYPVRVKTDYDFGKVNVQGITNGKAYYGDFVKLTAIPAENAIFTGWTGCSGSEVAQFQVRGEMDIEAHFQSTINSHIVTLPDLRSVPGAKISKAGRQAVTAGDSFGFNISTYNETDLKNLIVKVDGTPIKPVSAATKAETSHKAYYEIDNIQKDLNITVTLDKATPVDFKVEKIVKNKKGYVIGHIAISEEGPYYYGDIVTLSAFNEDGTNFVRWSDSHHFTQSIREYEINITEEKAPFVMSAIFDGIPTDIEDIEAASIVGGTGCVWVRGVVNAKVSLVSMSGRVERMQSVEGDTRLDVPAGIYVVVLENKAGVRRMKVVVK